MSAAHDITWDEARRRASALATRLPSEAVPLPDADRRVTTGELTALVDLPGADTSAMDGWAVSGEPPWDVASDEALDASRAPGLLAHQALPVVTGSRVPVGTTAILRSENAHVDSLGVLRGEASEADIRRRAEECARGDVLVGDGVELTPPLLGLLAAAGHDTIDVTRPPRVRLVLVGDELQDSGLPQGGRVRDALGPQLPAWLDRAGARVVDVRRIDDDKDDLVRALCAEGVDLVITTGGTAAGPRDHVHAATASVDGRFIVDGVAVRPGHPMVLAAVDGRPIVALPGNPQAAIVGLLTLAMPLIEAMLGRVVPPETRVRLDESLNSPDGITRLVGGVLGTDGFRRSTHAGAAMLRGLAASTGYAVVPPGGAAPGETVRWLPLA